MFGWQSKKFPFFNLISIQWFKAIFFIEVQCLIIIIGIHYYKPTSGFILFCPEPVFYEFQDLTSNIISFATKICGNT